MHRRITPTLIALCFALQAAPMSLAQAAQPADEPSADAPAPPPGSENLTEDQKLEKAKEMYAEGEKLFAAEKWKEAEESYEQAYFMFPAKHGFAYKVGLAAWKAGDCAKADEYFRHFVQYETDKEGKSAQLAEANHVIGKIAIEGCDQLEGHAGETIEEEQAHAEQDHYEDQPDAVRTNDDDGDKREPKVSPLMIGGITALVVGAGGAALGAASYVKVDNDTDYLAEKSDNTTTTSEYPAGNYANDKVAKADRQVDLWNGLTYTGFALAGVGTAVGVTLIVLDVMKKKKQGGNVAHQPVVAPVVSRHGTGAAFSMKF